MSVTQRPHDDAEVLGVLRVRGIEIVDDDGKERISLSAAAGGLASITVRHPLDSGNVRPGDETGDEVNGFLELSAGDDAEEGTRAGICVYDGDTVERLDIIDSTIDRAYVEALEKRVRQVEGILSVLSGAWSGVGVLHPDPVDVQCPRCKLEFPAAELERHVGGDACELAIAEVAEQRRLEAEIARIERGEWRPTS